MCSSFQNVMALGSKLFPLCYVLLAFTSLCLSENRPPCSSLIYCHGPLLHTIQMAKIYEDSKTFVDMKLKRPANETLEIFEQFMAKHNNTPTNNDVKQFLSHNFEPAGQEFEDWVPNDWVEYPKYLDKIQDPLLREWGASLNLIWKELGRKMKDEVKQNQELYSIIWVPHPVIVPGGRFREFYYWDSYWIVQGLLLSEMYETVKGKLENFLYIVDTYGHIPNGGRVYYLERSQPPLMIPMIKLYLDFTNDLKFISDNIHIMEKEFDYWLTKHAKTILHDGKNYTLAVYGDFSKGPRPESYSEDIDSAAIFRDQEMKEFHYSELKAGAESGWDFSSRWFITNSTNKGNLTNLNTRSIVPVDLNALIYWNAVLLAEFHDILGNKDKASNYSDIGEEWLEAVTAVLWHEEVGAWLDYDLKNSIKRDYFYPTNISPLWTGCYKKEEKEKIVRLVLKYLQTVNVMYPGGIPTTKEHTGEQWDFPNAWPPLQHIMIVGLNSTGDEAAQRLAFEIAEKWTRSNYKSFNETATMYEKYDATVSGGHGGGGEYEVQFGFGWTNGVIMDLLDRYGDVIRVEDAPPEEFQAIVQGASINAPSTYGQVATALLALIVSLTAGYIGLSIYKRRAGGSISSAHSPAELFLRRRNPTKAQYTELKNISRRSKTLR